MTAPTINSAFLIWEDEDPGSDRWWITRAREASAAGRRDFFIAEDDLTNVLVCVMLPERARRYHIITVIFLGEFAARSDALSAAKTAVVDWLDAPHDPVTRQIVQRWRLLRLSKTIWRNLPLALAGFAIGGALGLMVAVFAVSSGLVGWPMLLAGLVIGAGAGPALKYLIDRRSAAATVSGPWGRFALVTIAAIMGAAVLAGGVFTLFWN
jgi:hypothetical protein